MPHRSNFFLEGIIHLDRHEKADRRGVFRQSFASIALAAPGQAPLEGCNTNAIARSVQKALADGLFDDLSWLASPAAGVALYEIAHALPLGPERRELGRRVGVQLYAGNAGTFVAIATRMATASARGLSGAGIRARIALALNLPGAADVPVDPLALALVSTRETAMDWLGRGPVGSLPERRLAGQLLERAAREAATRARDGDDSAVQLFQCALQRQSAVPASGHPAPETIEGTWRTLLADRETLVWRHVASARGLLAAAVGDLKEEIATSLKMGLSPTEWRRGATSLVASIAIDPDHALPAAIDCLRSPLIQRDPGIAMAMLWGIPRVADSEPEAADELLDAIARAAPLFVAEGLAELRADIGTAGALGSAAAKRCAAALSSTLGKASGDQDVSGFAQLILRDLSGERARGVGADRTTAPAARSGLELRAALERALDAFVEGGTRDAHAHAQVALDWASETVAALEAVRLDASGTPASGTSRDATAILIRTLDVQLLESGLLRSLLLLNRPPSDLTGSIDELDTLNERLARWLLASESIPFIGNGPPPHATLHLRQLRALLHLVDGDSADLDSETSRRAGIHERWTSTCRQLVARLGQERASPLRRAIAATVARALDALVRDTVADPADVLLYAAMRTTSHGDLAVLAEASMQPDVTRLLRAYARFDDAERHGAEVGGRPGAVGNASDATQLAALESLMADLPSGASQRIESLRGALAKFCRALAAVQNAHALRPLTGAGTTPLAALEDALERLSQLTTNALRRCGNEPIDNLTASSASVFRLVLAAGRAIQPGADPALELRPSVSATIDRAYGTLPRALAGVLARILPRLSDLPIDSAEPTAEAQLNRRDDPRTHEGRLPGWMPSRRTLGGFYVQRQIGGGAAGTVFVVTRSDERHDTHAERFALKVPDYDATAARSLSESDFLKLFRDEAGALLAIPEHENLAKFVTFDAGAKPKPILVMELIEGTRCDQLLASRLLTMPRAFALLDGVLAGLEAMHSAGVGHLDIKPSNVVLRGIGAPVLVDFGLAGRHVRPGCATSSYGAPEVWSGVPGGVPQAAPPADIYSFGCFAYEVLTAATLFDAANEVALISSHLVHDGAPPPLKRVLEAPQTARLGDFLQRCLRRRPEDRTTASAARSVLRALGAEFAGRPWPLAT